MTVLERRLACQPDHVANSGASPTEAEGEVTAMDRDMISCTGLAYFGYWFLIFSSQSKFSNLKQELRPLQTLNADWSLGNCKKINTRM